MYLVLRLRKGMLAAPGLLCLGMLALLAVWSKQPAKSVPKTTFLETLPVLIIDAGHGGADGGASSPEGLLESELNLSIALKLNALARFCGVDTVMTRESADIDYPSEADTIAKQKLYDQKTRVALINSCPDGILISIHQNFYPDSRPWGAQVLYGHTPESEAFGTRLHEHLVTALNPENRRVAAPIDDNIYLMRNAQCTAVLVECGFLSNPQEAAALNTEAYQKKLAVIFLGSYLEYTQMRTA